MDQEEHKQQVSHFLHYYEPVLIGDLDEALHTVNELGLWPDGVVVSEEQALFCWGVVEKMRTVKFPNDLRV